MAGTKTAGRPAILSRSAPVAIRSPAIELRTSRLAQLGLTADGQLEAPEAWHAAGWYTQGPTPGETGPAVMAGHVDSDAGPAVFYRLGDLRPGDTVEVRRADGKTAVFTVYSVESHPKDAFPTSKVYGDTGHRAELRLITCGGSFDETTQHYENNIIVYARLSDVAH